MVSSESGRGLLGGSTWGQPCNPPVRIATKLRNVTQRFLNCDQYGYPMWIDDTSADVIKVDFDALYHGDVLVEGDTSEQFSDVA